MIEHRADSLKYQWRIVGHVMRSAWATGIDKSVAYEIVDNYRKDKGNSRASLSYLQKATGADRKTVISSTRRLVEFGPFSVVRQGVGTRPTEYAIDFNLVSDQASSGAPTTTSENGNIERSSGVHPTPASGIEPTTSGSSSGVDSTESVLHVDGLQADVRGKTDDDCAPPSAPPTIGLEAIVADRAQGGFEELWRAYHPIKGRDVKKIARAAYEKLAPDTDLHARMVESAGEWFDAWASQGNPTASRKTLAGWIADECYESLPPTAYKLKERKAKPAAKAKPVAANDNEAPPRQKPVQGPMPFSNDVGPFTPTGRFLVEIVGSDVADEDAFTTRVELHLRDANSQQSHPLEFTHTFYINHPSEFKQGRGQRFVEALKNCFDIGELDDTEDLHFRPVWATVTEQLGIHYEKFEEAA